MCFNGYATPPSEAGSTSKGRATATPKYLESMYKVILNILYAQMYEFRINELTGTSLAEVSDLVQQVFSRDGFRDYQSRWDFVATWHNVSRYAISAARNYVCNIYCLFKLGGNSLLPCFRAPSAAFCLGIFRMFCQQFVDLNYIYMIICLIN